jgi:Trehalose-6-phosphate synthase
MSTETLSQAGVQDEGLILQADRFIIATNRGPVEYYINQNDELKFRRGSGGVVTALSDTVNSINSTWVALAMTEGDRRALKGAHEGLLESPVRNMRVHLHYVEVPRRMYHKHYDLMSNRVLWFTQHYLWEQAGDVVTPETLQDAWDNGYTRVNEALANAICAEVEREASKVIVMLHDYHLYLVAGKVRERYPDIAIQQFIHIPWPDFRYWASALPTTITRAIFDGLLGNDILGFQTRNDANNFIEGVRSLFEGEDAQVDVEKREIVWHGHRTLVRDYPISISVTDERKAVRSRPAQRALETIKPLLREHTIMRVDRIEPTKNIVQGFEAYDTLLEQHPELREKTTFLAFLVPSRLSLGLYRQYRDETMAIIEKINKKYGTDDWTPIHPFVQNDRVTALAALQYYDALLVNSLIDGMNLVAKEGPAVNKNNGVLVLSRSSGAFQQLEEASIPISPADRNETAAALYKALMLPKEERQRLAQLARAEVERDNLHTWIVQQVQDMNDILSKK